MNTRVSLMDWHVFAIRLSSSEIVWTAAKSLTTSSMLSERSIMTMLVKKHMKPPRILKSANSIGYSKRYPVNEVGFFLANSSICMPLSSSGSKVTWSKKVQMMRLRFNDGLPGAIP